MHCLATLWQQEVGTPTLNVRTFTDEPVNQCAVETSSLCSFAKSPYALRSLLWQPRPDALTAMSWVISLQVILPPPQGCCHKMSRAVYGLHGLHIWRHILAQPAAKRQASLLCVRTSLTALFISWPVKVSVSILFSCISDMCDVQMCLQWYPQW